MGIQKSIRPIILCADDYAATQSISQGIRALVSARRLSAVSCLSSAPCWPEEAAHLKALGSDIDVGLHFNLTLGFGTAAAKSLPFCLFASLTGRADHALVERLLHGQLDRFETCWGKVPDFLDGHQHVHVFPGIRRVIVRVLTKRYPHSPKPWLRRINPSVRGHDAWLKAVILKGLASGSTVLFQQAGFPVTKAFSGLYSLREQADYPALMAGWLRHAHMGELLMCHPSSSAQDDDEGIGPARLKEFFYLSSPAFLELCQAERIVLSRFVEVAKHQDVFGDVCRRKQ